MNGVLVLDKPTGVSSAGAVESVKHALGAKRAGHGGTLDPLATGVLPICLGEATKLAQYLLNDDKEYECELVLGVETDTLDRTGAIVATREVAVTREAFERALAARVGEHDQIPPMYSAIKQRGFRLYERARAGEEVERTPRRVRIDRLELLAFAGPGEQLARTGSIASGAGGAGPRATIAIACGKGTYVRSLVDDLGRDVGCGAHVAELRRTRSGVFTLAQAQKLDALDPSRLVAMTAATRLPIVKVADVHVARIRSGVQMPAATLGAPGGPFQLVDERGSLLAIAHVSAGKIIYDRVVLT